MEKDFTPEGFIQELRDMLVSEREIVAFEKVMNDPPKAMAMSELIRLTASLAQFVSEDNIELMDFYLAVSAMNTGSIAALERDIAASGVPGA